MDTEVRSAASLRCIRLLAGASDEVVEMLAGHCVWRRFAQGGQIVARNGRDREVHLLVSGLVRVTAFSTAGRQVTYCDLRDGEWFGDLSAIDHAPRSADVIALSETLVASIRSDRFLELLACAPSVSRALIVHLGAQVRELSERIFALSTIGVDGRVDAELLRLAYARGVRGNRSHIEPAPTHADIASRVGTSREQVTRELSRLAQRAIIQRRRGALDIVDVSRLDARVSACGVQSHV